MGDRRKRTQQNSFNPAEHRRVGADSERQAKDRRRGKAGAAAHLPKAVAQILQEVFHDAYPAFLAALFFDLGGAAERAHCREACLIGRHPRVNVFLNLAFQMVLEFVAQFLICL